MGSEVVVLHVDADAFFASVEQRQKPSTALAPVVVCGLGPRGVVATASYEARRFGVGSAMPTVTARRRCPQGLFLAPRMQAYREHSAAIMAVLAGFADVLEQVSIDEAYLVVSAHRGSVTGVLAAVVDAVWQGTGLRVSVGAGRSKVVAKLASTAAKPRGQRVITRSQEQEFLDVLPVAALPGIGPVAAARLREVGINSVAQLRAQPVRLLERLLGTAGGAAARSMAVGQDSRMVGPSREVKSVSAERTLDFDVPASQLGPVLEEVLNAVTVRLHQAGLGARTVTVRLRDRQFSTIGRSVSLAQASDEPGELRAAAVAALAASVEAMGLDADEESGVGARLLGVSFGALSPATQLSLLPAGDSSPHSAQSAAIGGTRTDVQSVVEADAVTVVRWVPGQDVMHTELGRGWVVRVVDSQTSPSGAAEVAVRFEVTGSRSARQRRFTADNAQLSAVGPVPVQPLTL